MAWRSHAALAAAAGGDLARARELATEEVGLARAFGAPRALVVALRAMGLLSGEADERVALLQDAVAVGEGSPAALERARALADLGAELRRQGRRADAREPLREAAALAAACGATALAERAQEDLVATGARPRRVALRGLDALTPGERRVARLAAGGRSNREIAQALFISRKTVEMHLRNAYGKLGIASREHLPAALAGPGEHAKT
jgi:DNA-binding CsgD family transcriptional regulator